MVDVMQPIYLDYAASAPLDRRVADAMGNAAQLTGNPSSIHAFGRAAREAIDLSRTRVARLFGAEAGSVTFTSGATEANALAVAGAWHAIRRACPQGALRILVSPFEHASAWETVQRLSKDEGAIVDVLPVGRDGVIRAEDVVAALTPETVIVSVMWANNVIGTLQPIAEIGRAVAVERGKRGVGGLPIVFHADAVQAVATQEVLPFAVGVDLLTFSGHKICGPKGVGALIRRVGVAVEPVIVGGGQEAGLRHGTENVAAIVGLGAAAEILAAERVSERQRFSEMRAAFMKALRACAPRAEIVGDPERSVPTTVFVRLPSRGGDHLMLTLDVAGIAVSAGSACDAGSRRGSRTLAAMFDGQRAMHGGVRVSFGRFTTFSELEECAKAIGKR